MGCRFLAHPLVFTSFVPRKKYFLLFRQGPHAKALPLSTTMSNAESDDYGDEDFEEDLEEELEALKDEQAATAAEVANI